MLAYSSVTTQPHVFTLEVALMWSLAASTGLFFVVLMCIVALEGSLYAHAQNICAYFVALCGMLLYGIAVVVDCSPPRDTVCVFLYPVSRSYLMEACINLAIVGFQAITSLSFVLSLPWARRVLSRSLAWGGGICTVACFMAYYCTHLTTARASCPTHGALQARTQNGMLAESLGISVLAVLACSAPAVLDVFAPHTLDGLRWQDGAPSARTENNSVAKLCLLASLLLIALAVLLPSFAGGWAVPVSVVLGIVVALACVAPLRRWGRMPSLAPVPSPRHRDGGWAEHGNGHPAPPPAGGGFARAPPWWRQFASRGGAHKHV